MAHNSLEKTVKYYGDSVWKIVSLEVLWIHWCSSSAFFLNDLDDWIVNIVIELADCTNVGKTGKTSSNVPEKNEDSVEQRCVLFGSHKQMHRNQEQLGSNLQNQIQRIRAKWDSAKYWWCGKKKPPCWYIWSGVHARSDTVPCRMSECTTRLLPIWPCLAGLTSQLDLRPTLSLNAALSSLGHDRPWLPAFSLLRSFGYCGIVLLVREAVLCVPCCHIPYMNNKSCLNY